MKYKFFGTILSDGSFRFLPLSSYSCQQYLKVKNIDVDNHPVWTGRRPTEQTEISSFIHKFSKKNK